MTWGSARGIVGVVIAGDRAHTSTLDGGKESVDRVEVAGVEGEEVDRAG